MNLEKIIEELPAHVGNLQHRGKVASYIPALAAISPEKFGLSLHTVSGDRFHCGDNAELFSIQSISKVFTLSLAMSMVGDEIWRRVGRDPSGNRFNSLVQLEYEKGIPRNPFINAGAIVICDILVSQLDDPIQALLDYMRVLSGSFDICYDPVVAESEAQTGFINRALANFLKGNNNLVNDVDAVLNLYFHQCAIAMSCNELAHASLHLANRGV